MAGCAFRDQPSSPPVTLVATELRMFSPQGPWMVEFLGHFHLCRFRHRHLLTDDSMAKLAVFSDHLAIAADMIPLMAAEATRVERMTDVVGMGAPVHLHLRKHVSLIEPLDLGNRIFDRLPPSGVELRILGYVKTVQRRRDAFTRGLFG